MTQSPNGSETWPELDWAQARDTLQTLQLWTQIVGKVRLAMTPWLNHSWHVPLYVGARGLGTSAIPWGEELLEIGFDFVAHRLTIATSRGGTAEVALVPKSVAAFHGETMAALAGLGVDVRIGATPNEVEDAIPFARDETHRTYNAATAHRFWRALVAAHRVLAQFRTGYLGKASPVHFFWGSFDLAVTRFSGRRAPLHPGGVPNLDDAVTREAYSHEASSAGFWPGNDAYPHAAFYSYAYPVAAGFDTARVRGGEWSAEMGEWLLPWEKVRAAGDPDAMVVDFLTDTYAAAADLGGWDRGMLECAMGIAGVPRAI